MALYTSYYTRQLALRPENIQADQQRLDADKTIQISVPRRHVDYTGPYLQWYEQRASVYTPKDCPAIFPVAASSLDLLPPLAYVHKPATNTCIKFAQQAPSKTRSSVNVAAWTADGRRCLTGTQAGEFCMWGSQSFQFETIIQAHDTPIRSMRFSNNGNFLLSGDDGGNVRFWRTNLELVKHVPAHKEAVRELSLAPSDLKFASASDDSTIRVWDMSRSQTEHLLAGHGGDVKSVDWHPTKSLLVSGSKDGLVKLWCARSGKSVATMHGHKATVMTTQWNGNGNWVLTSSRDQVCKVFDVRMQVPLATFAGQNHDMTVATWNPVHEDLFVAGSHDGALMFFMVGRPAPLGEYIGAHDGAIWCTAWHPGGHLLASGAADAATKFWCRCRPGDPFFDAQQRQQEDLAAAIVEAEAAPKAKAPTQAPLFAPPPTAGQWSNLGIPGIGEAVQAPAAVMLPVDMVAAAAAAAGQQHQQPKFPPPPPPAAASGAAGRHDPPQYYGNRGGGSYGSGPSSSYRDEPSSYNRHQHQPPSRYDARDGRDMRGGGGGRGGRGGGRHNRGDLPPSDRNRDGGYSGGRDNRGRGRGGYSKDRRDRDRSPPPPRRQYR